MLGTFPQLKPVIAPCRKQDEPAWGKHMRPTERTSRSVIGHSLIYPNQPDFTHPENFLSITGNMIYPHQAVFGHV